MSMIFRLSKFGATKIAERCFDNNTSYALPASLYLGCASDLGSDGASVTELAGDGYERKLISFDPPASRQIVSSAEINVGPATDDWDVITHLPLFDAASSGNLVAYARVDGNYAITAVNTAAKRFTIAGDQTARFTVGITIRVAGSTGNDAYYTVAAVSTSGGNTLVTVDETVASATADGNLVGPQPISVATGQSLTLPAGSLIVLDVSSNFSTTLVHRVLNSFFRGQSWTAIDTVYHALFTSLSGDTYAEPADNYARPAVSFGAASDGVILNDVAFGYPVIATTWGTIVGEGLLDSGTIGAGTLLARKARSPSLTGSSGKRFRWAVGDFEITVD